jgi:SM-20-related protein
MYQPFDLLINSYLENKVGIDTEFLSDTLSKGLQKNILQLENDGLLQSAGVGNESIKDNQQTFRGDKIYWMDKQHDNVFEQEFLHQIEGFIDHLNSTCYTGINDYEFHYALYEQGCAYKKHKDQFKNDNNRKYSLINYLNENWEEENGGKLKLYQDNGVQEVSPKSQTAVFFKSDEMVHEVMLANRSRMSITGWLKRS